MTDEEYREQMDLVVAQSRMLSLVDVDTLLAVVTRAESVGHLFVSPMEYQRALPNLRDQRKLLTAVKGVQQAVIEIGGPRDER